MANPSVLINDNFKVLSYLYDNRDKENIIRYTQGEIADAMGFSRPTVNGIFKQLKEAGYLIQDTTKIGRYHLTEEANKVIETFRKLK
jgi:DNA-binding MarR family transcriptional regulator